MKTYEDLKGFLHLCILSYICEYFAYMHVCVSREVRHVCPGRLEEDIQLPGTKVTNGYELPCVCWELNIGPLKEKQVLLAIEASLSLISITFILPSLFSKVLLYSLPVHRRQVHLNHL